MFRRVPLYSKRYITYYDTLLSKYFVFDRQKRVFKQGIILRKFEIINEDAYEALALLVEEYNPDVVMHENHGSIAVLMNLETISKGEATSLRLQREFDYAVFKLDHGNQLLYRDIKNVVEDIKRLDIPEHEKDKLQVYLGNDDELNGIHTAWDMYVADSEIDDDLTYLIEEDCSNTELSNKYFIVIS